MSSINLSVQRLRLQLPRDMSAHALRSRVEDAFRIASMPTSLAHRFVLLRRLRLVLPREASAQSLALQLEREWRAIESLAQPMAGATADAPAVWAAHEAEARALLLQRWLDGRDTEAWFWQRLLPTAHAALPLALRLHILLFEPLDTAPAHAAAVSGQRFELWRDALPRIEAAGQMPALMAELSVGERKALATSMTKSLPAERLPLGAAQARQTKPRASASPRDKLSAAPRSRASPAHNAQTDPGLADAGGTDAAPTPPAETGDSGPVWPAENRPPVSAAAAQHPVPGAAAVPRTAPYLAAVETRPPQRPHGAASAAAAEFDGACETAWAGLWFLLPLLLRQGLAQQPAPAPLFAAILQVAALRHGLDATARAWVEQVGQQAGLDDAAMPALRLAAEASWRLARQVCVRQARLPLRRVLHRPGRVWLTPHRVDVTLPLQRADVRIRRAGFDIDPGYVPWLDTVLHFHYL